jgi:hypothetical protein
VFTLKQLAVNGNDLIAAGFAPGKEIGAALRTGVPSPSVI